MCQLQEGRSKAEEAAVVDLQGVEGEGSFLSTTEELQEWLQY